MTPYARRGLGRGILGRGFDSRRLHHFDPRLRWTSTAAAGATRAAARWAPLRSPAMTLVALRTPALLAALLAAGAGLRAQAPAKPPAAQPLALAIESWAEDFEKGSLGPQGLLQQAGAAPGYLRPARESGMVEERDFNRLTHLDVLQRMLVRAEREPALTVADAVLSLAGVGFERSLADRNAIEVRQLGHDSLLRMQDGGVDRLLRAVAGTGKSAFELSDAPAPLELGRRVAAVRVLAQRAQPEDRPAVLQALGAGDARVRLAAAEALELAQDPALLGVLTRTLGVERHPVVSQALVRAMLALLSRRDGVAPEQLDRALQVALARLGTMGWRTDMELVDLAAAIPRKESVPVLIEILDDRRGKVDKLTRAVNERASPLLKDRAVRALQEMTGALHGADAAAWRAFWEQERDRIAVPAPRREVSPVASTRARFFDVPVTGREIAFLIDTSGSMDQPATTASSKGGTSRLEVAKEQLLRAVQAMGDESRAHVITFDAEARIWTRKPLSSSSESIRSLTEILGRWQALGGTNLYEALDQALALQEQKFGEQGEGGIEEVFLLTDGEPTSGEVTEPAEILELVRGANRYRRIRIHAVFTGTGKGEEFLRQLAEQNEGQFVVR